jgi:hypothetical protein
MIYDVKKFRHYLLGNSFIFFVDHQTLLYLVNKLTIIGRIAKWLLLLQKFDFKVVYKSSWVHFLLNHLSKISHGEPIERLDDQWLDTHLFNVGVDWYGLIIKYLKKWYFDNDVPKEERS